MAGSPDAGAIGPFIDPGREALLQSLIDHGVRFVLIGGAAIQSYGRGYDTQDVDLVPDSEESNLTRLASALNSLSCRLITDPADTSAWIALPPDYFTPRSLRAATLWNLATRHGQLDVTFAPSGFTEGYGALAPKASRRPVAGTTVTVEIAALEDIHESKRQATDRRTASIFGMPSPNAAVRTLWAAPGLRPRLRAAWGRPTPPPASTPPSVPRISPAGRPR